MKNLSDYLTERLFIFPSQVDEKLVINKDYNIFSINDEFYEFAKSMMDEIPGKAWKHADNISQIREIRIADSYKESIDEKINNIVKEDNCIFYFICKSDYRRDQWENMLDWINEHEDDMEFLANYTLGNGIYEVRVFETSERIIGLFGNTVSTSPYDGCRIILYAYK